MTDVAEPPSRLVREWAACGIVAGVSRFVPVPLLDDAVKERATRLAVARTLKQHDRPYPVTDVEVLYTGADGWLANTRRYLATIPSRVVLFPVRKYVAVFGSVKGVPSDVMAVLLLGRTVHRSLARGGLSGNDHASLRPEALRLRRAYEKAIHGMDLRLLTGTLASALSTGRELAGIAAGAAQGLMDRLPGRGEGADLGPELTTEARQVQDVLNTPQIQALMTEFDRRVDHYLGIGS